MRSELEQLEQIDQYLSGKMTPNESALFEQQMNADPALKSMVQHQELLIQSISRAALMAEINAVAGIGAAGAVGWGVVQWAITGVTVVGVAVAGVAIYNAATSDSPEDENNIVMVDANQMDQNVAHDTAETFSFDMAISLNDDLEQYDEQPSDNSQNKNSNNKPKNDPIQNLNSFGSTGSSVTNPKDKNNGTQTNVIEPADNTIGIEKNRRAHFPGGSIARNEWMIKNLTYPGTAKQDNVQGTVKIRFFVEPSGEISIIDSDCISLHDEDGRLLDGLKRAKYRKSIKAFEEQAERTFRISPKWIPATNTNGTSVLSEQVWYVNFALNGKSTVYQFENETGFINEFEKQEIPEEKEIPQLIVTDKANK